MFVALAFAAAVGFFLLVHAYFAPGPGNPGIDENAYLVAGKNFANHFTTGMRPATPYAYVGPMWIRTDDGWHYPKYPLGVPLLNAIAIWSTGGTSNEAAFYVSPVCGALAVLAMFFLTRALAGSFFALLGAVLLASNPTMLHLSLTPSSHAPDVCFALWGMVALLHWWRTGRTWAGIAGGLLLGFTVSIRYTEGLLVLPLAFAVAMTIRWRDWRTYVRAAVPVIAWAVPVAALAAYNLASSRHLTGYDSTNESIGFSWRDLQNKWQYTIQQLHLYGLFFVFPLGILGMLLMLARGWWRVGVLMLLWFVPSVLLYMAYYWGQQMPGIAYLRFFLAHYPPVIGAAMWMLSVAIVGLALRRDETLSEARRAPVSAMAGAGAFVAAIATLGVYLALPDLRREYTNNANLAFTARQFLDAVPAARPKSGQPEPVLIADEGGMFSRLLMHMQFAANGEWYSVNAFNVTGLGRAMWGRMGGGGRGGRPGEVDPENPVLFDPKRVEHMRQTYSKLTGAQIAREEQRVLGEALDSGRGVFAILTPDTASSFQERMRQRGFECKTIATWTEPVNASGEPGAGPQTQPQPERGRGGWFGRGERDRGGGRGPGGPGGGGGRGRFGMGGGGGGLAMPAMRLFLDPGPQTLQVIQVARPATDVAAASNGQ